MTTSTAVGATSRVTSPQTVFIASPDLLAKWSETARTPSDLLAFADGDADRALAAIRRHRPQVVILDQGFAATARGIALLSDLQTTPDLGDLDIRTLPSERSATIRAQGLSSGAALASMAKPIARRPSRHARRVRVRPGTRVLLDGSDATLIDLSTDGAQALSSSILKPGQRVRVVVGDGATACHVVGDVTWSALELGPDGCQYRVGIAFRQSYPNIIASMPEAITNAP